MRWSQGWKEKLLDMRELWSRILPGPLPVYGSTGHSPNQDDTRQKALWHTRAPWTLSDWGRTAFSPLQGRGWQAAGLGAPLRHRKHEAQAWLTLSTPATHRRGPRGARRRIRIQTKVPHIYTGHLSTMITLNHRLSEPGNLTGFTLSPNKWTMGVSWLARDHEGGRRQG